MEISGKAPILELLIQTDHAKTVELEWEAGKVRMIPFSGNADGPLFFECCVPQARRMLSAAQVMCAWCVSGAQAN